MSKSLLKFVDLIMLPASVMVLGKFIGIFLTLKFLNIPSSVGEVAGSIFSYGTILRDVDVKTVITYSDISMYLLLAIGTGIILFRSIYLHSTHIKPSLVARLAKYNLLTLIVSSYEVYHQAVAWIIFCWIAFLVNLSNVISGKSDWYVVGISIVVSIILTAILFNDIEKELVNIKSKPNGYDWV
jgi:hypothetical protein